MIWVLFKHSTVEKQGNFPFLKNKTKPNDMKTQQRLHKKEARD